jgi:UDP-GlcNAc:polypeptide alpha-N-acetylglucosaminyltransferase
MFFCRGLFLNEIPYDSRLDYLFVGEEILHSARFYTHGWDIFNPKENIVYHEYTRSSKPKIWNDINFDYLQKQSEKKVEMYLNLNNPELDEYHKQDFSRFGLGNERTLQEYYDFSGIDPETKTINKDFCGNTLKSNRKVYKRKIPTYIKILASILLIILLIVIINNVYKWNIGRI